MQADIILSMWLSFEVTLGVIVIVTSWEGGMYRVIFMGQN